MANLIIWLDTGLVLVSSSKDKYDLIIHKQLMLNYCHLGIFINLTTVKCKTLEEQMGVSSLQFKVVGWRQDVWYI